MRNSILETIGGRNIISLSLRSMFSSRFIRNKGCSIEGGGGGGGKKGGEGRRKREEEGEKEVKEGNEEEEKGGEMVKIYNPHKNKDVVGKTTTNLRCFVLTEIIYLAMNV